MRRAHRCFFVCRLQGGAESSGAPYAPLAGRMGGAAEPRSRPEPKAQGARPDFPLSLNFQKRTADFAKVGARR